MFVDRSAPRRRRLTRAADGPEVSRAPPGRTSLEDAAERRSVRTPA